MSPVKSLSPLVNCLSGHLSSYFIGKWLCPYLLSNTYVFVPHMFSSTFYDTSPLVPGSTLIKSLILLPAVLLKRNEVIVIKL